jgi:two-component system, NtrC family, sensor kinase
MTAAMGAGKARGGAFARRDYANLTLTTPFLRPGGVMARRSKAGGKSVPARRRKPVTLKRRARPKTLRRRTSGGEETTVARLTRKLDEVFAQQAATAKVLQVISGSAFDLQTVLDTLVESAMRLGEADAAAIWRPENGVLKLAAHCGISTNFVKFAKKNPITPGRGTISGRVMLEGNTVHVPDVLADPEFTGIGYQSSGNYRANLGVPLLRNGKAVGVFMLARWDVKPFSDKQIELVNTFANQAVIAIENVRLFEAEQQRTRELTESLEQQTATAKVLEVISRSAFDLQAVFETVVESSARLCGAERANLYRFDGELLRVAATFNVSQEVREWMEQNPIRPGRHSGTARAALERRTIHIPDILADPDYTFGAKAVEAYRTILGVPILKGDDLLGVLLIYLMEVRPFTDQQIALVETFADQAAIAIENVRLFEAEQQRTRELTESLAQQTATSDVLRVISSSPGDLKPVFDALLANAARLCEAQFGNLVLAEGDAFRLAAMHNVPPAFFERWKDKPLTRPSPVAPISRVAATKDVLHVVDYTQEPAYKARDPIIVALVELGGARSVLAVPMLKDDSFIGALIIYRQEVRAFTDKQIALVQNFAAQAVIAIENARLLTELRQRTDDLTEALEQQTATSQVLQVISSSPGDLEPVFAAMLENAVRICDAKFGNIYRWDGQLLHLAAAYNTPPALVAERKNVPLTIERNHLIAPMVATKAVNQVLDAAEDAAYTERLDPAAITAVELGGVRTCIAVPMLKENELIGSLSLYRQEVRPFTDKQIALVASFAAQAVIAIENTRLLSELREALEQQTATAEVLRAISSSPGDLKPVFDAVLANAVRICHAKFGNMALFDGTDMRVAAMYNAPRAFEELRAGDPVISLDKSILGTLVKTKKRIHVHDVAAEEPYASSALARLAGARSAMAVPMLRDDNLVGALAIYDQEARPFTDKQIELLGNFAAQAVIAIENARLLTELRQRTTDLTESLEQQTATSEVLKVISSSPGDLEPVFAKMLENAVRICDANFGNIFRWDGDGFGLAASYNTPPAFAEARRRSPYAAKVVVHVADAAALPTYLEKSDPAVVAAVELGGVRTALAVPMLKENELVGSLTVYRQHVRPFTDKQIELVKNFAAQAVIAIENARLLSELRESLEQQTATSEVLQVISSSPGELEPVFQIMLENATRICEAKFGTLLRFDGEYFHAAAQFGTPPELVEAQKRRGPFQPTPGNLLDRVMRTKQVTHTADDAAETVPTLPAKVGGARSTVFVPMLKDDVLVGAIVIYRQEVRPFTDKQIKLVQNFAAQAVIAIENTRLLTELRQRTADLTESLEQQTATAKVLEVISRSAFDLQAVFEAVVESSAKLCGADRAFIFRFDGELLRVAASYNTTDEFRRWVEQHPIPPGRHSASARVALEHRTIHIADVRADREYTYGAKDAESIRTVLGVPILKGDELLGVLMIFHLTVKPFTDKQIALVETFADQAAIAIENVRLLEAEQQRTRELSESLEQQTATSEVLQVISSSPGDLKPVFAAMLGNAVRISGAKFGIIHAWNGETLHLLATHNLPPAFDEARRRAPEFRPGSKTGIGRMAATKTVIHIADLLQDEAYLEDRAPQVVAAVEQGGVRTMLAVPMLKENEVVGAFTVYRQEVRPFTDKQIELVQNFAAQAVIAIENARLLSELRQRTTDLTESLEQQTATSEVLRVISSSPGDLEPVFASMLENAVRICDAKFGNIYRWDGDALHILASLNTPAAFAEARRRSPFRPGPKNAVHHMIETKTAVHVPDVVASEAYVEKDPITVAGVELADIRTFLAVPMLKENELIGAFALARQEVRAFTDKQIALVASFAAQAVIAIENARLLSELRQRTDELGRSVGELRALGEVSQAVNSTLDLETVLSTIVAKAVQLSNTDAGAIYVFDGADREFHLRATYGMDQELIDALRRQHIGLDEPNVALTFGQSEPIQIADLQNELHSDLNEITLRAGFRARLVAPLLRGAEIVGMLVVRRRTPGAFPPNTVDVIKTFAAQSVLAIQNARLFKNLETQAGELARSLADLRTAQDRLVQTEKLASLGQLTAGIAHEIKNPLNFVNNFSSLSVELIDELQEALQGIALDAKTRTDIAELADMLRGNLDKVVQHGKRADSIVKNMLLHSRQGSGERQPADINAIVEESLNLAYHGARAEKQGFNITLQRSFDPAAGKVELFPQEITRVLLNLIANGFYAATKRKAETDGGYEPTLAAATKNLGDSVEIRIRDNGTGIPPEVRERMFNPFFTTKPAGEGTGLGLSLSHDIIVKQHAGSIEVDTRPGEFTEFRIVLPRGAAAPAKTGGNT